METSKRERERDEDSEGDEKKADAKEEKRTKEEEKGHSSRSRKEKKEKKPAVPQKSACGWVMLVPCESGDTENILRDRYSPFGTLGRILVTFSSRTGSAWNALVEFETASDAEAAIKANQGAGFAFVA